jgi:protocatechuate 3,4-dioxygenase beta subunit
MKHRRALTDLQAYELLSHNATSLGYTLETSASTLFSANTSYALTPENTIGPYYVSGELIRTNVTDGEAGVPVHLEMQFVDINTCLPVEDLTIDIWSCNATGVYSGIDVSQSQGGLDTTFLRGVQVSDTEGVVEFDTIFPGHYTGRATHEHVVSHINGTILPNGTYTGGTTNHIGQLFFDESLRSAVEATYPYNTNTQAVVSNDDDMWAPTQADADYDPFPEYVMLGNSLSDGLLMFITIGIDSSANYTANAAIAAYYQEDGGHTNTDGTAVGGGGSGGGPSGNGTAGGNGTNFSFTAGGNVPSTASSSVSLTAISGFVTSVATAVLTMT